LHFIHIFLKEAFAATQNFCTLGSLLALAAHAHRKKLGRSPERQLSSSSRLQRVVAIRPSFRNVRGEASVTISPSH
jgi:hypothetical protein